MFKVNARCIVSTTKDFIYMYTAKSVTHPFAARIERLDRWMGQNGLKLNAEKTQLMWLGSRHQLAKLTISQLPLSTTRPTCTGYVIFNG